MKACSQAQPDQGVAKRHRGRLALHPRLMCPMASRAGRGVANAMTIDVEDYFQVEAFASTIDRNGWENFPRRVERNTERLLDILGETRRTRPSYLGWMAQRHPALVRRIVARGTSWRATGRSQPGRRRRPKTSAPMCGKASLLEDTGGVHVRGYRAPTFSIGRDSSGLIQILAEEGYRYSSSVYREDTISTEPRARLARRSRRCRICSRSL